jgi:hypothetical protein
MKRLTAGSSPSEIAARFAFVAHTTGATPIPSVAASLLPVLVAVVLIRVASLPGNVNLTIALAGIFTSLVSLAWTASQTVRRALGRDLTQPLRPQVLTTGINGAVALVVGQVAVVLVAFVPVAGLILAPYLYGRISIAFEATVADGMTVARAFKGVWTATAALRVPLLVEFFLVQVLFVALVTATELAGPWWLPIAAILALLPFVATYRATVYNLAVPPLTT